MRVIALTLRLMLGCIMLLLSLAWLVFFGAVGVAACSTVVLFPLGLAAFGLATMPLWSAAGWIAGRSSK